MYGYSKIFKSVSERNFNCLYFRTIFKKYTGISPAKYIMSFKILKAKELLTYTDLPVKEVATGSGIDNAEYFSTLFKRETGISPLDWRELSR